MRLLKTLPFILAFYSLNAFSFGANGHRTVAQIASQHLTAITQANLMEITDGDPLAELATWPDDIKSNSDWNYTKPWHYVSIDDDESFDDFERSDKGDVLEALDRFEAQLRDPNIQGEQKRQALAFYIHFVGDIHQPLHVGRRDDLGGNKTKVTWFNKLTNIHSVWDGGMIDQQQLSFSEYAIFLDNVTQEQIQQWQTAEYLNYAKESKQFRSQVYDFGDQSSSLPELGYQYSAKNIEVVNLRMQQAGIRLAGTLNDIFGAVQ